MPRTRNRAVQQFSVPHRVEDQSATVVRQLFQHGRRSRILTDLRVGMRYDRTVEVDGYCCVVNGHRYRFTLCASDRKKSLMRLR